MSTLRATKMDTTMALMKPKHLKREVELEPWIETFTGKTFYFLDPKPESIDIRDIAHSLAYTCRYTGHSKRFYSVAEHSLYVSYLAANPLAGLLHDASEAYITDIASPIKPYLNNYRELEDKLMLRIAGVFGFDYPLDEDIKDCDATQLKTEAKYLLPSKGLTWAHMYPTKREHGIKPECMSPEEAERAFLERFEEVKNESFSTDWSDWPYDETYRGRVYSTGSDGVGRLESSHSYTRPLRERDTTRQDSHCGEDANDCCAGQRSGEAGRSKSKGPVGG